MTAGFAALARFACATLGAAGLLTAPALSADTKDLLSGFDFQTGQILIVPPEGVKPDYDWSVKFVMELGGQRAHSAPLPINWSDASRAGLPESVQDQRAYILNISDGEAESAETMLDEYRMMTSMTGGAPIKVKIQLTAGFQFNERQAANICRLHTPAAVDVWVKPDAGSSWRQMGDQDSAMSLTNFVRAAIIEACPVDQEA
ncbi:MAG: hypothetical protein CME88_18240 [Hirschia sp.]|nr:hypothetical protein [Hirschia sp.]MBF18543.1 hypothetical protein [Hirschia sp.]MBF20309.1 hypothetical protein [Hirschia sp.]|tara:strand:+ start:2670 stop:3275 length:606 start_codon:yes stop_codon:yes gene_type:complete